MAYNWRYYWKLKEKPIPFEEKKNQLYELKKVLYHLHFEDKEILRASRAQLKDCIMDAVQICNKLGVNGDYQSVINVQMR